MPHKKFQHFLKWVDILSEPKQIYRKRKERLNRKIGNPYLSPRRGRPTQPSRPTGAAGSSSPPRASKLLGGMPPSRPWTTRRRRGPSRPPRASFSRLETPWSTPPPFPPLQSFFPSSYARIRRRPKLHRSAPPWTTWPPCPRTPTSKSTVFLVLDFVFP